MPRSLCISIRFLLGRYHGQTDNGRAPEWPPSPLRLFQALVSAAHTGRGSSVLPDGMEAALCWLEQRDPPLIVTPTSHEATPYVISVPNNDHDVLAKAWAEGKKPAKTEAELRTMKTVRPTALEDDETVHFLWTISDDEWSEAEPHCRALADLTQRVIALGWGMDLVAGHGRVIEDVEVATMLGNCWRPAERASEPCSRRPIPVKGTLDALHQRHHRFLSRIKAVEEPASRRKAKQKRSVTYEHVRPITESSGAWRSVAYLPDTKVERREYAAFALRPVDGQGGWYAFPQRSAVQVAGMVRCVACKAAKDDQGYWSSVPGGSELYVAGHTRKDPALRNGDTPPRFSYLPLPSIGGPHADGMIRRVLIAEPFGGDGTNARWATTRLKGRTLTREGAGEVAMLDAALDGNDERMVRRYTGGQEGAREWVTVTPVVLPGYDSMNHNKASRLLLRAVGQSRLPGSALEEADFTAYSWWSSAPFREYHLPAYLRGLPLRHVRLVFREPVTGPIAVGAGRHCGLGVFAVCPRE